MKVLSRSFYQRDTVTVSKDLLGKCLIRKIGNKTIAGIITETEAYRFSDDTASHACRGMTERNKAMFGQVGCAYVYFTYGMYYCVNAVARSNKYEAGAVLIRALKPTQGTKYMIKNRKTEKIDSLTSGPAKLTQAMNITKKQYGRDLTKYGELYITEYLGEKKKIISSQRIGIKNATEKMWNFKIQI